MGVMGIGEMPMAVAQARMRMDMAVGLARRIPGGMIMAMMDVMVMTMVMGEQHMLMLMAMALGQMQPKPRQHQGAGQQKLHGDRLAQDRDGENRADEGGRGEIGACARRADVAQREHEEDEADAIAQEAQQAGDENLAGYAAGDEAAGHRSRAEEWRESEGQYQIHDPGGETLQHGDQGRIEEGDSPRQIVVEGPGKAGPGDGQGAQQGP